MLVCLCTDTRFFDVAVRTPKWPSRLIFAGACIGRKTGTETCVEHVSRPRELVFALDFSVHSVAVGFAIFSLIVGFW